MDLDAVHTLYDVLAWDRFDLLYSGRFHDEHSAELIDIGEDAAKLGGHERGHRQRLSFVMVEAYQNIVRHRAKLAGSLERAAGRSMFLLRCGTQGDEVVAIDPVPADEIDGLRAMLARIRGSDLQQLKQLFLDRLRDGTRTIRGGAGLGLIEMARRSGNGMRHEFLPIDHAHRLFVLQVLVGGTVRDCTPMDELMRMHALVAASDVLLLCRLGGSAGASEAVMRMLEKDEAGEAGARIKRAFLAASDWLREPGFGPRSFVALARSGQGHALAAGGCLPLPEARRWADEAARINGLTAAERERHYRNRLLDRATGPQLSTGLLDLARLSAGPLGCAVHEVADGARLMVCSELQ